MVETSFQGTPEWYGGKEGVIKNLVENARDLSQAKYQKYGGERIAPFSPLQQRGFKLAEQEATNPEYSRLFGQSGNAIRNALGQNISNTIAPYLQAGTANPVANIDQYMNPYNERVTNQIATLGNRNLQENILPNVQNKFIGAGQYGSTGHQNLTNRAIRDTQEAISQAQGNALQGGYNQALQTATGQQERNLQAGQLAGTTAGRDVERQIVGGEALQNLAGAQQNQGLRGALALNQFGGQQQQQGQNAANTAYQEFQNQANFPYFQQARLNEVVRGLPVNSQQFAASATPQAPQASPWTQGAGLLAGAAGAFNQRPGFAKGGAVHQLTKEYRHYADGGVATNNPIQAGVNDAMDTAELKSMRDQAHRFNTPQVDPFWAAIARAGASVAANRQPGALAAVGQGMQEGLNEYQKQLGNQDARGLQSAKIMEMIDNTRRLQHERNRSHQLEQEKFGQHKKEFGMSHALQAGHLGLAKEKLEHEKNLYEKGLKGTKGKSGNDIYKKSNETAYEEARKSLSTLPTLKSNLKSLKGLAEKLDTGPTKGRIARTSSTLGSLAGVGSAEDIDNFDSLTNALVLDLGNQLKGSQIALGKLKIIEQSKPQLTKVKGGNLEIINHMQDLANLSEEKAKFMSKALKSGVNALDAETSFNEYADAKLEFEEGGKKFPNKPEDFLEGMEFEKGKSPYEMKAGEIGIESMTDEELQRIAEGT